MEQNFGVIAGSIVEMNRYLQKIKEIGMREFGLRAGHLMVLYHLGRHEEGLSSGELTRLCREDKAAVSRTLAALTEKGYVHTPSAGEKRAYRTPIMLTESGKELVREIDLRIDAAMFNGGAGLTPEERTQFYAISAKILENLKSFAARTEVEGINPNK